MAIGYSVGSFNARFGQRASAYQQNEMWRQRRAAASQQFLNEGAALGSILAGATSNYISGMGAIVGQMALDRMSNRASAVSSTLSRLI